MSVKSMGSMLEFFPFFESCHLDEDKVLKPI